ncbi:biopolymer transport protein ExbD/TolR [bacterium BMS3Abin05]|nr:biopolymer transport protein ExbD/TolR [bacterium BMS3Abin05]GBE27560.1 biopolymer transport protein ExbD/TolR [bacterium BMS3Bbin03]HDL78874.1 hypothetical protein [Bacteroidota bacterium]
MAFKKKEGIRDLEFPSLIDIIFLLLIFFLITMQFSVESTSARKSGAKPPDIQLPHAEGSEDVAAEDIISTLLFQIQYKVKNDPQSPRVVYVLEPAGKDSISRADAFNIAKRDSMFAEFPKDFLEMNKRKFRQTNAGQLISNAIYEYKEEHFLAPSIENTVEIRAEKNIEFKIINYIMQECSAYKDTIPRVIFRTLSRSKR